MVSDCLCVGLSGPFHLKMVRVRSNAYAFSLILAIFLLFDGLEIVVGAEVVHALTNPRRAFHLLDGVISICALLSLVALKLLPP